tara:strand:+ start:138 stop:818 length:681 start_codon:yes stop_codon:yes gene_type:complete
MNINHFDCGFPYIVIDNFYNKNELDLIWRELDFLLDGDKFDSLAGSATRNGKPLSNKKGLFLDSIYKNRKISNILTCNRKLFNNIRSICNSSESWFFRYINGNYDNTILSYYEDEDYYDSHSDQSIMTSLTWLYKEPKKFEGGDLYFKDNINNFSGYSKYYSDFTQLSDRKSPSSYLEKIEVKNNRMLIFPGMIPHQVDSVKMDSEYRGKGLGRFVIANLMNEKVA